MVFIYFRSENIEHQLYYILTADPRNQLLQIRVVKIDYFIVNNSIASAIE